jgi:VWFA-related protein
MRPLVGLVVALLLTSSAAAQNTPTFRSRTELVMVPVKVTKGKQYVPGLQSQQFRIFEDGVERKIASFEEVRLATSSPARPASLPPNTFTNQPATSAPGHLTVFLMDVLNTETIYQDNLRKDLIRYLETHAEEGPFMVAVLAGDGLHVVQNYSADPEVIRKALDRIRPRRTIRQMDPAELPSLVLRPRSDIAQISGEQMIGDTPVDTPNSNSGLSVANPHDEFLALAYAYRQAGVIELSLDAMTQLANSLAAIPGRKSLIWGGGGLPDLMAQNAAMGARFLYVREKYDQAWAALNAANIAVYPVRAVQTYNPAWTSPASPYSRVRAPSDIFVALSDTGAIQDMLAFAQKTGGTVCTFQNDLGNCFNKAVRDSADYYLLSYYTSGERRPGWHTIKVKVDSPHASVRARQGYMMPAASQDTRSAQRVQINTALGSPLDFTTVPLTLRWAPPERNGQTVTAPFDLLLNAQALTLSDSQASHLKFDLVVLAFDALGKRAGKITQTVDLHPTGDGLDKMLREGIRYTNRLNLPAGKYTVRIVVRDALSGKVGSLTVPLQLS